MMTKSSAPSSEPRQMPTHDEFLALVGRAVEGGGDAIAELRQVLEQNEELWQSLSDLGRATVDHLLGVAAGDLRLLRRSMERFIAQTQDTLLGGGDSNLEKFLVHRIVVSHLEVTIRQKRAICAVTAAERQECEQLLDRANKRQVECLQALLDFRRS